MKAAREKQHITHKGTPIQMTPDFSSQTTEAKNKSGTVFFKYWKKDNCQLGLLYPVKLSFRNNKEIKVYSQIKKSFKKKSLAHLSIKTG